MKIYQRSKRGGRIGSLQAWHGAKAGEKPLPVKPREKGIILETVPKRPKGRTGSRIEWQGTYAQEKGNMK